ncbi:short chain dehydrogenase [Legionella spiritensis]|uniref:Short chain dehydrogenase n=1 Tax=Legionella spiritensis TaxID=452 RepID=A0A0W0ZAR3_LEGSP|nr:short chain dehydrogenase [Legionella spiritensis]KTD66200.1 short chain dehydrogenase [Legionella spiritensis]SNV35204.1 short chain dehydrogenase [Legionella spiritensis]
MKIIVIGATGVIGQAVVKELGARHDLVQASRSGGDIEVDITDRKSIEAMFKKTSRIDAVVLATGKVHFDDLTAMSEETYQTGLQNKLMGQVNVVLIGQQYLNEGGSFTLTSGILSRDPIRYGSSASMVNGAIDSFVVAAAIEMPNKLRINCVSPTVVTEAMDNYAPYFRGFEPVSAARVALAYSKSVEGLQTGQVYQVG